MDSKRKKRLKKGDTYVYPLEGILNYDGTVWLVKKGDIGTIIRYNSRDQDYRVQWPSGYVTNVFARYVEGQHGLNGWDYDPRI